MLQPFASHRLLQTWTCRAPVVLSKEEVDAERAALRAVDARPIKKVAEARLRKRKRLSVSCTFRSMPHNRSGSHSH